MKGRETVLRQEEKQSGRRTDLLSTRFIFQNDYNSQLQARCYKEPLYIKSPHMWQGSKHMGPCLLLADAHWQEAGSRTAGIPTSIPIWVLSITSSDLTSMHDIGLCAEYFIVLRGKGSQQMAFGIRNTNFRLKKEKDLFWKSGFIEWRRNLEKVLSHAGSRSRWL